MVRRRQAVTIRHVAADAGVSLQTVSRVLHDEPSVSDGVRARVKESIERLGYVPSIAAQRMSGSRSYIILAINDRDRTVADWQERQGTDWVDQMLLGGMLRCAEYGYRLIFELVDTHSDHVTREVGGALGALRPDGVILTPPHSDNPLMVGLLKKRAIPFVRIGSTARDGGIPLTMDDRGGARLAAEHLIALGHRRIGFIAGSSEYALSGRRVDGWRDAMTANGLAWEGLLAEGDFSYESGEAAARMLLGNAAAPSAIIASNDRMALATLEVARQLQLVVPDDLSLISFDNTPIVRLTQPPLTAIDQPIAEAASRAVDLLMTAQADPEALPGPEDEVINIPMSLVERASTAPLRRKHGG
ncbi:MAG: LacI family DNA-binding transcriptional regulator [Sphingomonas sp.]